MANKSKASRIIIVTIIIATAYFSFHWMGLKYGWKPTKGQRIATKIAEQERLRQTKTKFEKLITEKPSNTNWRIKDEWKRLIANKKITVIYSEKGLSTAAEIVNRLRSLGAVVSYAIALEVSFKGEPGNIYYQFSDFETVTVIQAAIVDIESFRITSTGSRGQIIICE
ncbi:MAG: hypothetical protein U0586_08730 [Candidatus Brocadiaceae bacterium]